LIDSSRWVKSPTLSAESPTSTLAPAVLMRTSIRSAKGLTGCRVQNEKVSPFRSVSTGVISQLLIVPWVTALSKLAAMYESAAPS